MKLSLITAMDRNNLIGDSEKGLPWHYPIDLKYFKTRTDQKTVVMGRKTFESPGIPKPLPNRRNIVLTSNPNYFHYGVESINNFAQIYQMCKDEDEVFIIGGAGLYELAYDKIDYLYITKIHKEHQGDIFFPIDVEWNKFKILSSQSVIENDVELEFIVAERK